MIHVSKTLTAEDRRTARALLEPQPEHERWDLDVRMAFRCGRCGKFGYGLRRDLREALQQHWQSDCPARHTKADTLMEARILVPKQ